MRITKKIFASAMAVCLGVVMGASPAFAADAPLKLDTPYKYTISISAGSGSFNGLDETLEVDSGDAINLSSYIDPSNVVLPDSKYYVKGLRLAGHDYGEEAVETLAFPVTEDAQYVVAYGLAKDQVAYTVNYVDAAGNQIADPQTFYGNPGDKPVVAFRYVDGYLPTTYNMTGTLKAGQENVFTFTYNAAPGVVYETVPGVAPAAPAAAPAAPAGAAAVADAAAAGEVLGEDGTPLATPTAIEDIDDNENPLASGEAQPGSEASANEMNPFVVAGVAVLLVVVIGAAALALRKRNKKASAEK